MADNIDLTVIIPANNEGEVIGQCLDAVFASDGPENVEVLVAANGCTDNTADRAHAYKKVAEDKGWQLTVLDLELGGKLNALNKSDEIAQGRVRVYLDADVIVSGALLDQILEALDTSEPRYGSGTIQFSPTTNLATSLYAKTYARVPYIANGLPGAGLFAVNSAGRAKWGDFPMIISDDTYVRLLFSPAERVRVQATYHWPLVDGFANLVRVRRRQNAGVAEIEEHYPELLINDDKLPLSALGKLKLAVRNPVSFSVYAAVQLIVAIFPAKDSEWRRGR